MSAPDYGEYENVRTTTATALYEEIQRQIKELSDLSVSNQAAALRDLAAAYDVVTHTR